MKIGPSVFRAAVVISTVAGLSSPAASWETGYLVGTFPGMTMGLPSAANPPPGLYFLNLANYGGGQFHGYGSSGPKGGSLGDIGAKMNVGVEMPGLLWSTPWQIFGASWSAGVMLPMVDAGIEGPGGASIADPSGLHNLILSPANLSWNLGKGLFVGTGLDIQAPTGTITGSNGLGNWGQPFWTIEPRGSVSYLADGYNLTASFRVGFNTENSKTKITDGAYLHTDLTASKKFGKWELGAVGYAVQQITDDEGCGKWPAGYCGPRGSNIGLGGLVGYDFGPVNARLMLTDSVHTSNFYGGWRVYTQISFPLWMDKPPPRID